MAIPATASPAVVAAPAPVAAPAATPAPSSPTKGAGAAAAQERQAGLANNVHVSRDALKKLWTGKDGQQRAVRDLCGQRWDAWSTPVRADFLKRAQTVVLASVQTTIPKKQWAQWEVTLKFCLDDIFISARAACDKKFATATTATEKAGIAAVIDMIVQGRENDKERDEFEKKVKEMMAQMKPDTVPGFDVTDKTHVETLRSIRSLYAIEWVKYLVAKMIAH